MKKRILGFMLSCSVLMTAGWANATPIANSLAGLNSPDVFVDFGSNEFTNFTPISTEFLSFGVEFTNTSYFTTGNINNIFGGFLTSLNPLLQQFSIDFSSPISDVSFVLHDVNAGTSSFSAFLGADLVETFSAPADQFSPNNFYGFSNLVFDRITVVTGGDFNMDSIAYNLVDVPEPPMLSTLLMSLTFLGLIYRRRRSR